MEKARQYSAVRILFSIGLGCLASPVLSDQSITLESGLTFTFYDVVLEEETGTARFLAFSEDLGAPGKQFGDVVEDMTYICETYAALALAEHDWQPTQIIISLANRGVPFGEMDLDATQFIVGYTTDGTTCTEELH